MPERRAIDMRVRPPAPGFETLALYWDKPRIIGMGRDIGFEPAPSYIEHSLIQCLAEMAAAGIVLGVIRAEWRASGWAGSATRRLPSSRLSPTALPCSHETFGSMPAVRTPEASQDARHGTS